MIFKGQKIAVPQISLEPWKHEPYKIGLTTRFSESFPGYLTVSLDLILRFSRDLTIIEEDEEKSNAKLCQ